MKKGLTLVEILCVTAILAVLAAILTPVFVRAKLESRASAAKLNLKGFWQGLILYQSENEQKVEYGPVEEMGLPSVRDGWWNFVSAYTGDSNRGWETKGSFLPCGLLRGGDLNGMGLIYMASQVSDWPRNVSKLQEETVVISDPTCNAASVKPYSQTMPKRAIGVTLGGQIRDRSHVDIVLFDQRFYR